MRDLVRHARGKHKQLVDAMEPVLRDLAGAAVTIWERWWQTLNEVQAGHSLTLHMHMPLEMTLLMPCSSSSRKVAGQGPSRSM